MQSETTGASLTTPTQVKISTAWMSTLLVFAYVDIFSLYRADVRADIAAGKVSAFTINGTFLLGTTIYISIASVMVFLSVVLPSKLNRIANVLVPVLYAVTIAGGAIGEWGYYVLGSAIEFVLLGVIVKLALTLPRADAYR
jgi:Family of unknown function (DUF6326)